MKHLQRFQSMIVAQARERSYDILDIQGRQLVRYYKMLIIQKIYLQSVLKLMIEVQKKNVMLYLI